MSTKTIPALTLRSNVDSTVSFPVDDGIQTYRVTAPQLFAYLWPLWFSSRTISAAGSTLTSADRVVYLNPTSANFVQNLPACASLATDFVLVFKNIATNGNTATLDANASELIDNALTLVLGSDPVMDSVTLINTGTKWLIF